MTRALRWAIALGLLQALLFGVYWHVEQERSLNAGKLGTEPPRVMAERLPALTVTRRDGTHAELTALPKRPMLLHVWATWCPPCRAELPSLLDLPDDHDVDVVALALDDNWADVDGFLQGRDASRVVLGDREQVAAQLNVQQLPATWLVSTDGALRLRFDGPRNWRDVEFVERYLDTAR